jgi:ABC-2 type transport system permease protein
MISVVARKEFREIVRDGRFRWLAATCVLLIAVSTATGLQLTHVQLQDRIAATSAERENFLGQGAKNPHAAAHFGQYAFRPVLLPAALDPGVSSYMGSMIWLEAHRMNLPEFRPAEDSADFARAGQLSVAWVLQFVLPLFVIVVTFGAVAGERERGTLALAMSQGMGLGPMLLGKAVAAVGALFAVLLPLLFMSVLVFLVLAPGTDAQGAGSRLLWMGLGYLLYLLSFAGLSLLVSTLASSRRSALFALIAIWLLVTVAVPRMAADLAATVHPTPTATEFWAGIRAGEGDSSGLADDPGQRVAAIRQRTAEELLTRYQVDAIDQLPVNFTAVFLQRLEEADAPIFDYNYAQLWQTYESQRRLQRLAAILSPTIAMRELSMAMAGADPFAQRHFSVAAETYRRDFVRDLNEIQAVEGAGKRFYVASGETWEDVAAFEYEPPSTATVLGRHALDLGILILWACAPFSLALVAARRARPVR